MTIVTRNRIPLRQEKKVVLESNGAILCKYDPLDFEDSVKLFNDAEATKQYENCRPKSKEEVEKFNYEHGIKSWDENQFYGLFSIFTASERRFAGHIYLIPWEEGVLELACILTPEAQNLRVASELGHKIVEEYCQQLLEESVLVMGVPFQAIVSTSLPQNVRSKKILKSLGLTYVSDVVRWNQTREVYMRQLGDEGIHWKKSA